MLTAVIFFTLMSVGLLGSFVAPTVRDAKTARDLILSTESYYAAEAGAEDVTYRIKNNLAYSSSYALSVGNATADVQVASSGNSRTVTIVGDRDDRQRNLQVNLEVSTASPQFFYGIQVGDGGLSMGNNARVNGNVYANYNIVGANGATITGDATVAGGINEDPSFEWTTTNSDQFFATANTNRDVAQSFTAGTTGPLNRVSLNLAKVGNPTADLTLRVASDNDDKPSTSSLATAVISRSSVGITPSWIDASFASPPTLNNGNKYWLVLDYGSHSDTNYWNWRKDSTDGYAGNTGKYTSNCCSGSPVWTNVGGDLASKVWLGGVNTKIEGMTIGDSTSGTGRANSFVATNIHGSACPNGYCLVENPARAELPISDGVITDWKNAAVAGGIYTGDYTLTNGASASLGPKKITGKLILSNNATLTITGTVWVAGDIDLSNGCLVQLDPSYGSSSGLLIGDSVINVSNNCTFAGSGQANSYIMVLGAKDATSEEIVNIDNGSLGVIYYAGRGRIKFSNNAQAKEATAHGITMDNNSVVTYESGLASLTFSSGPGGSFAITDWQEIE